MARSSSSSSSSRHSKRSRESSSSSHSSKRRREEKSTSSSSSSRKRERSSSSSSSSRRSSSRDHKHEKERERERSESRKDRDRSHEKEDQHSEKNEELENKKKAEEAAALLEMEKLEAEMEKRRQRVKAWQMLNKGNDGEEREGEEEEEEAEEKKQKGWSLEDDDDDEEKAENEDDKQTKGGEDEEEDPLDAFMQSVQEEVKELNEKDAVSRFEKKGGVLIKKKRTGAQPAFTSVAKDKGQIYFDAADDGEDYQVYVESTIGSDDDDDLIMNRAKKRDMTAVDHASEAYIAFRRKFYIELPEIARMSEEETEELRQKLDNIQIRGKGAPKPITGFHQCGLNDRILAVCEKNGYKTPTPIQAQAIPTIMMGRDVIGIAKTGSGKTLSYLLPMFRHIQDQPPVKPGDGPIGLVMAPTRELVNQIHTEAKRFCKRMGMTTVPIFGGAGVAHQIGDLKRGCEIVVCTPGRMIDILCTNAGRVTNLKRVTFLVLDEADRMFDMGFEPQITKIIDNIRPDRQTVLFSATFPKSVEYAARKVLKKPLEITVGGKSVVCDDVEQHVEVREEHTKFSRLLGLLGEYFDKGQVLVFVDRQEDCDTLFRELLNAKYPCMPLHGGQDQSDRASTLSDFRKGDLPVLIATSVAARGLDVPNLILVVNYDCPNHYEDYVHRCGRTGRAGRKGFAYTFLTPDQEEYAPDLMKALELSRQPQPEELEKMAEEYERKKKEGIAVKRHGSGFGGKGFKFNAEEEAKRMLGQRMLRLAYGETENEEEEAETERLKELTEKQRVDREKKKKERLIAGMMRDDGDQKKKSDGAASGGGVKTDEYAGLDPAVAEARRKAEMLARSIEAKVGIVRDSPSTVASAELEINDYPQHARWKATHKDALAPIQEFTGCAITTKGSFVPPGQDPPAGERKLYLLIEGPSERAVWTAKTDIKRMIAEIVTRQSNQTMGGRYSVV